MYGIRIGMRFHTRHMTQMRAQSKTFAYFVYQQRGPAMSGGSVKDAVGTSGSTRRTSASAALWRRYELVPLHHSIRAVQPYHGFACVGQVDREAGQLQVASSCQCKRSRSGGMVHLQCLISVYQIYLSTKLRLTHLLAQVAHSKAKIIDRCLRACAAPKTDVAPPNTSITTISRRSTIPVGPSFSFRAARCAVSIDASS